VVIPPGGTFSFNRYLIDVVEANGYEDAYVIFGNRTVLGPGGGVCQVSSTMFRAAFYGGFPIVERWAHAYRVGYYEPPVGMDATVFAPDVDLKFKNDTGAYLLVEPIIDEKNTTLTFNLYGTKPNREVKLVGPEVSNVKPHGPDIYNDDPSLPKGVVKQVDFSVDGEDVTVYREIYIGGQLSTRDKFFSRYAPWQAIFQRGTR
jgi:vancomycin resistance protein YoaR